MSSFSPDYFIHAANVLLLAAYSVREILWLRLLAVASALAAMPYFLLQPTPLWAAFGWSVVFSSINIYQAGRLLLERRAVTLTPEETRDIPEENFMELVAIALRWGLNPNDLKLVTAVFVFVVPLCSICSSCEREATPQPLHLQIFALLSFQRPTREIAVLSQGR
jgi:hypothetical protein